MRITRFTIGFVLGYAVATIRRSKDADPVIERLKVAERRIRDVAEWWKELPEDHPAQLAVRRLGGMAR